MIIETDEEEEDTYSDSDDSHINFKNF